MDPPWFNPVQGWSGVGWWDVEDITKNTGLCHLDTLENSRAASLC